MYEDISNQSPKDKVNIFSPRSLQQHIIDNLKRFNVLVCHRRFGKTYLCIALLVRAALTTEDKMFYGAYLAPTRVQAKEVAWTMLKEIARKIHGTTILESELKVRFANGAVIKLLGASEPDSLRGLGLNYVILDEVAMMKAMVWDEIIQPAISDKIGTVVFIGTPKGANFFQDIYEYARSQKDWNDAKFRASETGVINEQELANRKSTMTPEAYEQEYEVSFHISNAAAYYGKIINQLEKDDKITSVPHEPNRKVYTAWDIGFTDATAIWFYQKFNSEVRVIDYYENEGEGLPHYIKIINSKPYVYGVHYAPFDIKKHEFGTGKKIINTAKELGVKFIPVTRKINRQDGIEAVRMFLPKCVFDKKKTKYGIKCLKQYQKKWNDKMSVYLNEPQHDWSSHSADAFRYLALSYKEKRKRIGQQTNYLNRRI